MQIAFVTWIVIVVLRFTGLHVKLYEGLVIWLWISVKHIHVERPPADHISLLRLIQYAQAFRPC
jgi:hypothetical protein